MLGHGGDGSVCSCWLPIMPIPHVRRDATPTALFFRYNTQLGPPYQVLIDTNFINFSIRNKVVCWVGGERRRNPFWK